MEKEGLLQEEKCIEYIHNGECETDPEWRLRDHFKMETVGRILGRRLCDESQDGDCGTILR